MLDAGALGGAGDVHRLGEIDRDRFFAVHMLAGGDSAFEQRGAHLRRRRVEEDSVVAVRKRGV